MDVETRKTAKPSTADAQGRREALVRWLLDEGKHLARSRDVLGALCRRLVDDGIALQRVMVSVRVLHPQIVATGYVWRPEMAAAEQVDRRHDVLDAGEYLNSPIRKIHEGSGVIRRRLTGSDPDLDFPILRDIREQGATDYVAFPMPFSDGSVNVISFASDGSSGFSDACIAHFEALVPVLVGGARNPLAAAHGRHALGHISGAFGGRTGARGRHHAGRRRHHACGCLVQRSAQLSPPCRTPCRGTTS